MCIRDSYSPPLTHIKTDEKIVAITFDTEWSSSGIERLLPVLADYQIKSTFFVTGDWAREHPIQLRSIAAVSYTHLSGSVLKKASSPGI